MAGHTGPSGTVTIDPVPEGSDMLEPMGKHPFALVNEDGLIIRRLEVNGQKRACTYRSVIGAKKGQRKWGGKLVMRGRDDVTFDDDPAPAPVPEPEPDPYEVGPDGGIWERPLAPSPSEDLRPTVDALAHRYGPELAPGVCWCGAERDTTVHQRPGGNDAGTPT